jgi:YVTN family beta-propeller protein
VGTNPQIVAFTVDGTKAYVTNFNDGTVSVINATTDMATGTTITVQLDPYGIAASPDGIQMYVADAGYVGGGVSVIDTVTDVVSTTIDAIGLTPLMIAFPPNQQSVTGRCFRNVSLFQTEFVNEINWDSPLGFSPKSYQIYRNPELTQLAGSVSGVFLEFQDHNRKKNQSYTYYVVAITQAGAKFAMGNVTITSNCK